MEDEKKCRVGGMYESNLLLGEAPDYFFGFSHPLHSQFLFGRWRFSDIMGGAAAPPNPPATF